MSARIGLLDIHQASNEQPRTYIPKAVAAMLLQRLIAEEISKRVIRLKNYFDPCVRPAPFHVRKVWMPEKLPPAELPGIRFKDSEVSKIGRLTSNVAMLRPLKTLRYERKRDVPESLKGIEGRSGCVPEIISEYDSLINSLGNRIEL